MQCLRAWRLSRLLAIGVWRANANAVMMLAYLVLESLVLRELAQLLHLLAQRLDLTVHRLQRLPTHNTQHDTGSKSSQPQSG